MTTGSMTVLPDLLVIELPRTTGSVTNAAQTMAKSECVNTAVVANTTSTSIFTDRRRSS